MPEAIRRKKFDGCPALRQRKMSTEYRVPSADCRMVRDIRRADAGGGPPNDIRREAPDIRRGRGERLTA